MAEGHRPLPTWAWHSLLFGLVPLVWLGIVDAEALPTLGVFRYTLRAWPAAWLMTTHFLWLQPRLRGLTESLWAAGFPVEQVDAFQRRYLAILQGRGVGGVWALPGPGAGGQPGQLVAGSACAGLGRAQGLRDRVLCPVGHGGHVLGLAVGGRLWWGVGRLARKAPWLKAHPVSTRARRLAAGWVVVAGGSMLWHLLMTPGAPENLRAVQAWGLLISLVLLALWCGYAALEWQLVPRPLRQRGNGWFAARLALTLALVAMTLPLPR